MVSKTLSLIIFVLTVLCAAVLFSSMHALPNGAQDNGGIAGRILSVPSQALSRLSLFPMFKASPRPIAVMIENHEDARPHQQGLTDALMVEEFLVEGFISRFVAIFDANALPATIGPVRSLRPYFLDAIAPWVRTVFHAGGSPEALSRVKNSGEFYALNLLYFDDEDGSLRNHDVAPPHNLFLNKPLLKELLADVPDSYLKDAEWPPFPIGMPDGGEPVSSIKLNFFSAMHNVQYEYLPLASKYKRTNGGIVSSARPSNLLILEVPIDSIGEYGRLFMTLTGTGNAKVFHAGKMWDGRWSRSSITDVFRITDSNGKDIPFARGQIWVTVLPTFDRVTAE